MAADEGSVDSMVNLACSYKNGKECPVNIAETVPYLKLAINKGNATAMHLFHDSDGVPIDEKEALRLLKIAADKGEKGAVYNYGTMFEEGNIIQNCLYLLLFSNLSS